MTTVDVLTTAYRKATLAQRAQLISSLLPLWRAVDGGNIDNSWGLFDSAASALVLASRTKAVRLASSYFTTLRVAQGVSGDFSPVAARALDETKLSTSLLVTGLVGFKLGIRNGLTEPEAKSNAFVQLAGSASRLAMEGGRQTIIRSSLADPHALGWRRKVSPSACDFCKKVNGFGRIYRTEGVAEFRTHDHCACSAEVVYR